MVSAARERVGADPRFSALQAQAAALPIAASSIDVVVAVRLLVHLADPEPVFQEIARVLRPGGHVVIEFPNRGHLMAWVRYLTRRQAWMPQAQRPHEYLEGHFAHHPARVERQLRAAGLEPMERRSVSLFRSAVLKKMIPARMLALLEAPLQAPLAVLAPGPSLYLLARLPGAGHGGGEAPPPGRVEVVTSGGRS